MSLAYWYIWVSPICSGGHWYFLEVIGMSMGLLAYTECHLDVQEGYQIIMSLPIRGEVILMCHYMLQLSGHQWVH